MGPSRPHRSSLPALLFRGFKWVITVENSFNFNISYSLSVGYILEVDLVYLEELHNTHIDFPSCLEHSKPTGSNQEKLSTTPLLTRKHVLYYYALKQALKNRLKLVQIHHIIKFKQSQWLKAYIDFKTSMRPSPGNEFGNKIVYKSIHIVEIDLDC